MDQLQALNQSLIDKARLIRNDMELIIDVDSTHSDTFGRQEQTDYNAHYQTYGYHPLVAFDGLTGDFLEAELRSGNQYTSKGIKSFIDPLLHHYKSTLPHTEILFGETAALPHQRCMSLVKQLNASTLSD